MRKICCFTGTRAEYGLLQPLLNAIKQHPQLQLQLLVSGSHLSEEHGMTWQQIENDGFMIHEKVDIEVDGNTPVDSCRAMGLGLSGYALAFERLQPDLLLLLGDRYEAFAAAAAATLCNIPVAHLHGGELTQGATDDALRHAISKLSLLHFTATDEYRHRVIQLGEDPARVFNVGAIGLDGLETRPLLDRKTLEAEIGLDLSQPTLLLTFHPTTLEPGSASLQIKELLLALDQLQLQVIFTGANADAEGATINRMIADYQSRNPQSCVVFPSLGQQRYLSAMHYVAAVVGNSSSGIIEAPSFGIPTVNIGQRQAGRLRSASVIDCPAERDAIVAACRKALSESFRAGIKDLPNPYRQKSTVQKILEILLKSRLGGAPKEFYDLPPATSGDK